MSVQLETIPIGERWQYVVPAYVCAFLPWAILYLFDFISPKWKSYGATRKDGVFHLIAAILPMFYMVYYAHLQRISQNFQEMMTAIVAILLDMYFIGRTIWGLLQLQVYKKWCYDMLNCLRALGAEVTDTIDVKSKLMVNSMLVDNEFSDTDVGARFSMKKLRLLTSFPEMCTIRWAAAFLCAFGKFWLNGAQHPKFEELFNECRLSLRYILRTTFEDRSIRGTSTTLVSLFQRRQLRWGGGAFHTDITPFSLRRSWLGMDIFAWLRTFAPFEFELNNLLGSYPAGKDREPKEGWDEINNYSNREMITIQRVESLVMAKHLDSDMLTSLREYNRRNSFPTDAAKVKAWTVLLEQCGHDRNEEIEDVSWIPNFPWSYLMVPLWDKKRNWRLLQASAHADIRWSILWDYAPPPPADTSQSDIVFDVCRDYWKRHGNQIGQDLTSHFHCHGICRRFIGAALDMVRTFLGEWLLSSPSNITNANWRPSLPATKFEVLLSDYLFQHIGDLGQDLDLIRRFVWECQIALQSSLAEQSPADLPASEQLMLLFILGYPLLYPSVNCSRDAVEPYQTGEFRLNVVAAPQNLAVCFSVDCGMGTATMHLKSDGVSQLFDWEKWINAAMGLMRGCDEWLAKNVDYSFHSRSIANADLRRPMMEIRPPHDELENVPGEISIWTGWPVFDVHICQFEVEQWLKACRVFPESIDASKTSAFDEEVRKAEECLSKIIGWQRF